MNVKNEMARPDMKDVAQQWGLIGRIEKRDIEILDHDPRWQEKFQVHAALIMGALGDAALQVEHIGSTSVPGLAAKPIIDILVVVADSANESSYLPCLPDSGLRTARSRT